jgi:hypothetical protein
VIYRPILHVDGPPGSGKTSLIEALLRSVALELDLMCMRAMRDSSLRLPREQRPRAHPELRRYRAAGAGNVALYSFPNADSDAFYDSDFMTNYSQAVVIEGDLPCEWVELVAYVVRPSPNAPDLLCRVKRDDKDERERSLAVYERAVESPESLLQLLVGELGGRRMELLQKNREQWERTRNEIAADVRKLRSAPLPPPTEHWAVSPEYRGIEHAQVVVVNVRRDAERKRGEELVAEVKRLRTDEAVFRDVFDLRGTRIPITALTADVSDPRDPGLRKALTRIKRTLRRRD